METDKEHAMKTQMLVWMAAAVALLILVACGGGGETAAPATDEGAALVAPTAVVEAGVEEAADVPEPTSLPEPTEQPEPTAPPEPTALPEPTVEPEASQPDGDLAEYLNTVLNNQVNAGPYRTITTVEDETGTIVITGEVIPPDSVHVMTQGVGLETEMIIIGEKGWSKLDGVWSQLPDGLAGPMFEQALQDPASLGVNSNVQFAGSEVLDGVRTWVITFDSTLEGVATSSVRAWIDAERDLIIRQEISGEAGGVESFGVQTVEYDSSITVEPPEG